MKKAVSDVPDSVTTQTDRASSSSLNACLGAAPIPALCLAYAPLGAATVDRCMLSGTFSVGRSLKCNIPLTDRKLSNTHFQIGQQHGEFFIEDYCSTNGTFVNGMQVVAKTRLLRNSVIRAGRCVMVFHDDARDLLKSPPPNQLGIAGRFHVGGIIQELREASVTKHPVLLAGPSGAGKELAARALVSLMEASGRRLPLLEHNTARFVNEDEATTALFGVGEKIFSGVKARPGLIEQAEDGALFLDEVHNLPERVQRSLLRVIEDGNLQRIGEIASRSANAVFILASNTPGPTYGLAQDLLNRLRVVEIPSLSERVADVPTIFQTLLRGALREFSADETAVFALLSGDHYEALALHDFSGENVRGLVDFANRIASRIAAGSPPQNAVNTIFFERLRENPVIKRRRGELQETGSHYEDNKQVIIAAYRECQNNISATVNLLESNGLHSCRQRLSIYLKKWEVR